MMLINYRKYLPPLLLLFAVLPALPAHSESICLEISNGVFTAEMDEACQLINSQSRYREFVDMNFLAEQGYKNVCSTARSEFMLGDTHLIGESIIAQATNPYPEINNVHGMAIGADAMALKQAETDFYLGTVFIRHYVHFNRETNYFSEELVMVSGSHFFRDAKGTIRLHGNLFSGADMSGKICLEH